MEESLQFVFLCIFSLFLRPWVELERRPSVRGEGWWETYFPGSPGSETGLWSPNIPELLGTSGREACRPDGNRGGGCCCCCCCCWGSTESTLFCACVRSVSLSFSRCPAKFPSGSVSVQRRTAEVSLDLFWAFSGPGLWGQQLLCHESFGRERYSQEIQFIRKCMKTFTVFYTGIIQTLVLSYKVQVTKSNTEHRSVRINATCF